MDVLPEEPEIRKITHFEMGKFAISSHFKVTNRNTVSICSGVDRPPALGLDANTAWGSLGR